MNQTQSEVGTGSFTKSNLDSLRSGQAAGKVLFRYSLNLEQAANDIVIQEKARIKIQSI